MVVIVEAHILVGGWWPRGGGVEDWRGQGAMGPIIDQMSKNQKTALWRKFVKKELDIMRFRDNEVNFEVTLYDHQNISKCS